MVTTIPSVTGLIAGGQRDGAGRHRPDAGSRPARRADHGGSRRAGLHRVGWYGLLAPKGLPADIRAKLESAARTALQRPDLLARVKDDGAVASGLGGPEFAAFMAAERKRWGEVIRDADLKLLDN